MKSSRGNVLVIFLAVVAIASLSAAGYFYLQTQQLQQSTVAQPIQIITTVPTKQSDETVSWKVYNNKYYSFKYPPGLLLNEQGIESQSKASMVTYLRPGYNHPQSEMADGYTFRISYGPFITAGSIQATAEKFRSQLKDFCPEATMTPISSITVSSTSALTYDVRNCMGDYTEIFASNGSTIFELYQLYVGENTIEYRKTLDQILSTFRFTQ